VSRKVYLERQFRLTVSFHVYGRVSSRGQSLDVQLRNCGRQAATRFMLRRSPA
jgi:hypothetical protein